MLVYVLVEYPSFMVFEGPFHTHSAAQDYVEMVTKARPTSVSHRIISVQTAMPVGLVMEYVPLREKAVS